MRMMISAAAHAARYQLWLAEQEPEEPDFPAAVPDTAATAANTPVTFNVLANDTHPAGETLTVVSASVPAPQGGVTVNGDGTLTFTPAFGFSGPATISYVVQDVGGQQATGTAIVTVAVEPAPTAVNDTATTPEDTPITVSVLGNDTHPAGDDLVIVSANVFSGSGAVAVNDGLTLTFTPAAHWNGTAVIFYTVEDENGDQSTASLTVTVTRVNDGPSAVGDTATTSAGVAVTINVIANDTDPDGDALTVVSASVPTLEGTASLVSNQVRYMPASGFTGAASITYVVQDPSGLQSTGMVAVTVNATPGVDADLFNDAVAPYYSRQVNGSTASFSASGSSHWSNSEGLGGPGTTTGVEWRITANAARGTVRLQAFTLPMPNGKSQIRWRVKPIGDPLPKLYVALGALDMTSNFFCAFDITEDATADSARVLTASSHISNAGITKHPTNGWWYIRFDVDVTGLADRSGTLNAYVLDNPGVDLLTTRTPAFLIRCENLTVQAI